MNVCSNCANGEYRGFPPATAPDWEVGTIYFWCPIKRHHDAFCIAQVDCDQFELGAPKRYDKNGRLME